MPALRCSQCGTNWPLDVAPKSEPTDGTVFVYQPCPECEGETARFRNATPIPSDEAESRKNHADFERYLDATGRRTEAEQLERAVGVV